MTKFNEIIHPEFEILVISLSLLLITNYYFLF